MHCPRSGLQSWHWQGYCSEAAYYINTINFLYGTLSQESSTLGLTPNAALINLKRLILVTTWASG